MKIMLTLFIRPCKISSVLCKYNNIFLVFFLLSWQCINFVCSHLNHPFQCDSRSIWPCFTHLSRQKSPKWLAYKDGEYAVSSPFTLPANSAWSHLWLFFGVAGGRDYSTSCTFTRKVQLLQCVKKNKCTKWQAENLLLPLTEWDLLISNGDKASSWHKIPALPAYRAELHAAPVPDFLPTGIFLSSAFRAR